MGIYQVGKKGHVLHSTANATRGPYKPPIPSPQQAKPVVSSPTKRKQSKAKK